MKDNWKETGWRSWGRKILSRRGQGRRGERKLVAAGLISLLILLTALSRGIRPAIWENPEEQRVNQLAWWGCLYPYTCLEDAMYLVEEPEEQEKGGKGETGWEVRIPGQELPVKIKWKCMDLF